MVNNLFKVKDIILFGGRRVIFELELVKVFILVLRFYKIEGFIDFKVLFLCWYKYINFFFVIFLLLFLIFFIMNYKNLFICLFGLIKIVFFWILLLYFENIVFKIVFIKGWLIVINLVDLFFVWFLLNEILRYLWKIFLYFILNL